ncbi:MAG: cation:proton antiporter [Desulfurococcales archaeon]|nr:cation:proton antiporter [Desulfurococcales archaeon]
MGGIRGRLRLWLGLAGAVIGLASISLPLTGHSGELMDLTVVGGVILASALLAEALGIVSAVFEIFLGFIAGLMGVEGGEVLDLVALLGGSLLMFMAGLEIDVAILRRFIWRSLLIGGVSFSAPALVTAFILMGMGYPMLDSALAAVGVSTTSVAVVYSIVRRFRMLSSWRGQVLLASAMIADVLSILAFTAAVFRPSLLLVVYGASLVLVPPLAARILRRLPPIAYEAEVRVVFALILAITLFSEVVGIHGILFAFLLGAALAETRIRDRIGERVGGVVFGFMAPVFFANAGLHIAPVDLGRLKKIMVILFLSSYPVKVAATHVALRLLARIRDLRIANVMAARLTVSTIIAYAGLKSGLMDHGLAAGVMVTALIATLVSGISVGGGVEEV